VDRSIAMYRLRRMDWWLIAATAALFVLGVLFIYSASYRGDGIPVAGFYKRQILWGAVGIGCMAVLTLVDYQRLGESCWVWYGISLALLALVLVVGPRVSGASRWLQIIGIRVQPSELAKLTTLIAVAWTLSRPGQDLRDPKLVLQTGLVVLIPFLLIFMEPDLGTAMMMAPLALGMMYAAGVPLKTLSFLVLLAVLLLPVGWLVLDDYQQERILVFFDADRDPLGAGWNKIQSEIAVGSGGLTGKGYLAGTQNVLGFLPRSVAPTDFIFSVVAEELGFVGSGLVLSLYAAVLIGVIRAALLSRDKLGRLVAVGVAMLLFSHVLVNIAMTIGLMPITGLPLPLMSYGGSFMVCTMCGLGLVQSVYVRRRRR